jgi:hypothetical protein
VSVKILICHSLMPTMNILTAVVPFGKNNTPILSSSCDQFFNVKDGRGSVDNGCSSLVLGQAFVSALAPASKDQIGDNQRLAFNTDSSFWLGDNSATRNTCNDI